MIVLPARAAMATNLTVPFSGSGGTAPYSYALISGAGSIDPLTGVYTSPAVAPLPTDAQIIIEVTDALLATAQATVFVGCPLDLLCDILQTELNIPGRVWIWDQKVNEPTDSDMFIVAQVLSQKNFSSTKKYVGAPGALNLEQSTSVALTLSLDVKSRSTEAFDRLSEVILALNSDYSESQQNLNSIRVFQLPSAPVVNLSNLDGAAIPYRFNITCVLQYSVSKTTAIPYYDTFPDPEIFTDA